MHPEIEVRIAPSAWPGSTMSLTLLPSSDCQIGEVRWSLHGSVINSLGARSGLLVGDGSTIVGAVAEPDVGAPLEIPVAPRFPPSVDLGIATLGWRVVLEIDVNGTTVRRDVDVDMGPPPPHVAVDELFVADEAHELLRKRKRTLTGVGSVGFTIVLLFSMAIGLPVGMSLAEGDAELMIVVGLTMGLMGAIHLGNFLLYGRPDRFPFTLERSIVRQTQSVAVLLESPAEIDLNVAVVSRYRHDRGHGSRTKTVVEWSTSQPVTITRAGLSTRVDIADLAPTVQTGRFRIDHWIRVQPASSFGTDPRFLRQRSDRPIIVVA